MTSRHGGARANSGRKSKNHRAARGTRGLNSFFNPPTRRNDEQQVIPVAMEQAAPAPPMIPTIDAAATIRKQQRENAMKHLKNVEGMLRDGTLFKDLEAEPDDQVDYNEITDDETLNRRSSAYMPKQGSPIASYLSGIHDDVKNHQ